MIFKILPPLRMPRVLRVLYFLVKTSQDSPSSQSLDVITFPEALRTQHSWVLIEGGARQVDTIIGHL